VPDYFYLNSKTLFIKMKCYSLIYFIKNLKINLRDIVFEVLTTVVMKISVFCV
jgi:hypothetical protein